MKKLLVIVLTCWISSLNAAYITDKLVAGLYKENKVSEKPLKALSSGTPVEVIERKDGFIKVRTSDGTIGWVEATYLTDEKPAKSLLLDTQAKVSMLQKQLDQLKALQEKGASADAVADLTALQEKLAKAEGQVSQLELQLQAARVNIKNLEEQKALFEREKEKLLEDVKAGVQQEMDKLEQDNEALTQQISQVAKILRLSNDAPVTNEVAQPLPAKASPEIKTSSVIKPLGDFVLWILVAISLITGTALGYFYMRHRVQQRFGSAFRL
jgi:SH3 domain protein